MRGSALDHTMEPGRRRGFVAFNIGDKVDQLFVNIRGQRDTKLFEVNATCAHHLCRILLVDQRQKQVLQRCKLVFAFVRNRKCAVKRLFEGLSE